MTVKEIVADWLKSHRSGQKYSVTRSAPRNEADMSKPPKTIRLCPWMLARQGRVMLSVVEDGTCAGRSQAHGAPGHFNPCRNCEGALRYVEEKK